MATHKFQLCLVWFIWREMNDRNFENHKWKMEELKTCLFIWASAIDFNGLNFRDFLVSFSSSN